MQLSIRASLAIHCLILVSEFGETDKITSEKIALSTGTNPVAIRSIMSALKKDGILNVKNGTGGTTLNMPPVCKNIFHVHTKASKLCPVGRNIRAVLQHSYSKFESALEDSLKTVTLADMIRDYHMQLEKEK